MTESITRTWLRLPVFWRVQIAFWGFVLLFGLISRSVFFQSVGKALIFSAVLEPLAFLVSGLLRHVYRRLGISDLSAFRTIGWIGCCSVLAAFVQVLAALVLRHVAVLDAPDIGGVDSYLVPFAFYVPIFFGWSLGYLWVRAEFLGRVAQQRAAAAEVDALRAELQRLRQQLDPHFLFNALNGIAAEVPDDPKAALAMLDALATYLRYSLDHHEQTVTSLEDEIEGLEAYMSVQRARFGPQLGFTVAADEAARDALLPAFLLQPLVENAVKYGRKDARRQEIRVEAEREGEWLHLRVGNDGRLPADWPASGQINGETGVGLANIGRRLALHYPERHAFTLRQVGDRVSARISLRGSPSVE